MKGATMDWNFVANFWVFYAIHSNTLIKEIDIVSEKKLNGPASYFPSIEKKYGQPIDHWIKLVQKQKGMKHMEVVN